MDQLFMTKDNKSNEIREFDIVRTRSTFGFLRY